MSANVFAVGCLVGHTPQGRGSEAWTKMKIAPSDLGDLVQWLSLVVNVQTP
jgi:hypothetical protein